MFMKKIALLGIDLQNDFTNPSGSLFVKGAEQDVNRISKFIQDKGQSIDYIALSLDSHQPIHIAHQLYWKNSENEHPALFSTIAADDVKTGKWIPQFNADIAYKYLVRLEKAGEVCTIWPPHCILGTKGWALDKEITDVLFHWAAENNRTYELFYKGMHQATEHYSIFRAAVAIDSAPETQLNEDLLYKLNSFDELILVGEAADFCVMNSLKDIISHSPYLAAKTIVFTDCMSWIVAENKKAQELFTKAEIAGVRFTTSTQY